jgi:hypothetical protein
VLQAVATVDTQTVVPPLKTEPMTVGPMATPIEPIEGPTKDRGAGWNAGRLPKDGRAGSGGTAGHVGVAALAPATGPAIASAATTPVADTAHRLIALIRLFIANFLLRALSPVACKGKFDSHGIGQWSASAGRSPGSLA